MFLLLVFSQVIAVSGDLISLNRPSTVFQIIDTFALHTERLSWEGNIYIQITWSWDFVNYALGLSQFI